MIHIINLMSHKVVIAYSKIDIIKSRIVFDHKSLKCVIIRTQVVIMKSKVIIIKPNSCYRLVDNC